MRYASTGGAIAGTAARSLAGRRTTMGKDEVISSTLIGSSKRELESA